MLKDLGSIKVVSGDCEKCFYSEICGEIECFTSKLTGRGDSCSHIIGNGNMFRKEETWVECTKENTKVDDTVKMKGEFVYYKVEYIRNTYTGSCIEEFILSYDGIDFEDFKQMNNYRVKVGV